jgi:hypothetical protein
VEQSFAGKYLKFLVLTKSFASRFMFAVAQPFIAKLTGEINFKVLVKVPTTLPGMVTK